MGDQENNSFNTMSPGGEAEGMSANHLTEAGGEQLLATYDDLFKTIWDRILPTLGRVTLAAIMERTMARTAEKYPLIAKLEVTTEGVSFDALQRSCTDAYNETLHEALKELVANLIHILAMLTGDILVRQLMQEIEERQLA